MKKFKVLKKPLFVLSASFILGSGFVGSVSAAKSDTNQKLDSSIVISDEEGSTVLKPNDKVKSKKDWNPEEDLKTLKGEPDVGVLIHDGEHLSDSGSSSAKSGVETSFNTDITHPYYESYAIFEGSSKGQWLGSSPFNADKVTLTDTYHADGTSVSFSYPSPSITGSGETASWSDSVTNDWAVYHSYSGVRFDGFALYRVSQSSAVSVQFGSSFYTATAYDEFLI